MSKRRKVWVILGLLADGDTLNHIEDVISEAKQRAKLEGITEIRLDVEKEYGYYNDVSVSIRLWGYRCETNEEIQLREQQERESENTKEINERVLYEQLKKKYGY